MEAHDSYKEEVDPEEVDLWMQEMLRCYEQLTEWQDMGAYVNGKFEGNFDAIWSDTEKVLRKKNGELRKRKKTMFNSMFLFYVG